MNKIYKYTNNVKLKLKVENSNLRVNDRPPPVYVAGQTNKLTLLTDFKASGC